MSLPFAARAEISDQKLRDYLLDTDHPEGGPKARFFISHGFSRDHLPRLRWALLEIAISGETVETVTGPHGIKYIVDGMVQAPAGRPMKLRTVWIVLPAEEEPVFVTAYPAPGDGG